MKKHQDLQILKERLIETQQMIANMEERIKKIQKYIFLSNLFSFLRILFFIIVPILLYLQLAPLVQKWIEPYKNLLNIQNEMRNNLNIMPDNPLNDSMFGDLKERIQEYKTE